MKTKKIFIVINIVLISICANAQSNFPKEIFNSSNRDGKLTILSTTNDAEIASIGRYDNSPRVGKKAWDVFKRIQKERYYTFLEEVKETPQKKEELEILLILSEIQDEMYAVNTAPWPVSKTLWDVYRNWVSYEQLKALFDSASMNQVYSSFMFDLATYMAIEIYKEEGCSSTYQDILILIEQSKKYQEKRATKALKKIRKYTT